MKHKKWIFNLAICFMVVIILSGCAPSKHQTESKSDNTNRVATIFLHGYGGSKNSETFLVNQAVQHGVTKQVLTANVKPNGDVNFKGDLSKSTKHPIIKVNLEDNTNGNFKYNAKWIKNVLVKLKSNYDIQNFNFVGHSMGNLSFAYYMKYFGNDKKLPQLKKRSILLVHIME